MRQRDREAALLQVEGPGAVEEDTAAHAQIRRVVWTDAELLGRFDQPWAALRWLLPPRRHTRPIARQLQLAVCQPAHIAQELLPAEQGGAAAVVVAARHRHNAGELAAAEGVAAAVAAADPACSGTVPRGERAPYGVIEGTAAQVVAHDDYRIVRGRRAQRLGLEYADVCT